MVKKECSANQALTINTILAKNLLLNFVTLQQNKQVCLELEEEN